MDRILHTIYVFIERCLLLTPSLYSHKELCLIEDIDIRVTRREIIIRMVSSSGQCSYILTIWYRGARNNIKPIIISTNMADIIDIADIVGRY